MSFDEKHEEYCGDLYEKARKLPKGSSVRKELLGRYVLKADGFCAGWEARGKELDSKTDPFVRLRDAAKELGYEIGIMTGESPVHQGMAVGTPEFVDCVLDKRPHERWSPSSASEGQGDST